VYVTCVCILLSGIIAAFKLSSEGMVDAFSSLGVPGAALRASEIRKSPEL